MMFDRSAAYYDAVYAAKGKDYRGESRQILEILRSHGTRPGSRLLDVACGTGEHVRHLGKAHQVGGIDANLAMLRIARRKNPGVVLCLADMTAPLPFTELDVVTCLFSSVGYLPDTATLARAVRNMADALVPGGLLLLEPAITPDRLAPPQRTTLVARNDDASIWRATDAIHAADRLQITFEYRIERADACEEFTETHAIRLFEQHEYEEALTSAGLEGRHDPVGLTGIGLFTGVRR